MLALNTHTSSCWKATLLSYCAEHSCRKPLPFVSESVSIAECFLLIAISEFQNLDFIYVTYVWTDPKIMSL